MVKLDVSLYLQTIRDALSQCSLFSGLSDEQLDEVARHGELIDYKQNESIARQGEKGDGFFIVVFGETVVQMVSERSQISVELATLTAGDFFGEMATLLASERNANVVTSTPKCHVLRFSGGQFKKMLKNLPYFSVGLVQSLAQRLQRTSESKTQTEHTSVPAIPVATLRLLPEPSVCGIAFCRSPRMVPSLRFVDNPTSEVLESSILVPALRQR